MFTRSRQPARPARRGSLIPAIASVILVIGCCLALVLDRLWLDAARSELRNAAEAAALAAAGRLADDERINPAIAPAVLANAARQAASETAAGNLVAGTPLALDPSAAGPVQLGRLVLHAESGEWRFLQTDYLPTSVQIAAARTRELGNPVARLFGSLTGHEAGDAASNVGASLSNQVIGLRPFTGGPAPLLPIAILEVDPTGERKDTWVNQIESGAGGDRYRFDRATNRVVEEPDGLPEITLHAMPTGGKPDEANLQLIDLGSGLIEDQLVRQMQTGLLETDLAPWGGELLLDRPGQRLESSARIFEPTEAELLKLIGQKRLFLLYDTYQAGQADLGTLRPTRLVAGRIMSIDRGEGGIPLVVVQPTVLATRTALLADGFASSGDDTAGNPYVYKISLTR